MRPVIGITAGHARNEYGQATILITDAYLQAVVQAGGQSVIIPATQGTQEWEAIYSRLDGILFSGGGDIAPERFGAAPHPKIAGVEPDRDELELGLLEKAVAEGKPFLGICRGFQVVNVGLGGTLYTHLPDQFAGALTHDNAGDKRHDLVHKVELANGSQMLDVTGESVLAVNSHHHQGVRDLAPTLRATGRSGDGLIEAVELPGHPFGLAVQWHPEWLTDMQPNRKLFRGLVQAASKADP